MNRAWKSQERNQVLETRLRDLMREQGWKARSLAAELGVHETAISHWRRGRGQPTSTHVMALARVLHVDPNYLLGWSDKRPDQQLAEVARKIETTLRDVPELAATRRRRKATTA